MAKNNFEGKTTTKNFTLTTFMAAEMDRLVDEYAVNAGTIGCAALTVLLALDEQTRKAVISAIKGHTDRTAEESDDKIGDIAVIMGRRKEKGSPIFGPDADKTLIREIDLQCLEDATTWEEFAIKAHALAEELVERRSKKKSK